jgi:hypothetical protein
LETNNDSGDRALVEIVEESQPPPAPNPAPYPINIDKQIEQGVPPKVDQTLCRFTHLCHPNNCVLGPEWTNIASPDSTNLVVKSV